jgi:phosphatidylglycerophosphatase A
VKFAGAIASGLGVGLSPFAPGTLGSLWGVALGAATLAWSLPAKAGVLAVLVVVGLWASEQAGREWGHDHPRIVIDEVTGQYLTLFAAPSLAWFLWGFVLFRVADIVKPFPAGALDRREGGWFTMADDLVAGLYGALVLTLMVRLHHLLA